MNTFTLNLQSFFLALLSFADSPSLKICNYFRYVMGQETLNEFYYIILRTEDTWSKKQYPGKIVGGFAKLITLSKTFWDCRWVQHHSIISHWWVTIISPGENISNHCVIYQCNVVSVHLGEQKQMHRLYCVCMRVVPPVAFPLLVYQCVVWHGNAPFCCWL